MGSMSVGGLVTGFDTKALVDKLMSVERLRGDRIFKAKSQASAVSGAFTQLNGLVSKLGDAAKAVTPDTVSKASIWNAATATSSNKEQATATASGVLVPGSLSFAIDTVAQAGSVVTGEIAVADRNTAVKDSAWTLTLTNHGSPATLAFSATDTLNSVAEKINGAKDADVSATVIKVAEGVYRLQMTSKSTGADTTLALGGDIGIVGGAQTLQPGQDSRVIVGAGTPAEFAVTSTTTKVEGMMDGVAITLIKPSARTTDPVTLKTSYEQVTISAAKEPNAIADKIQAMVEAANAALTNVRINAKVDPNLTKAEAGKEASGSSGLFLGNATASDVTRRISDVFVGSSQSIPMTVGIDIAKDGSVSFDRAKFVEAYTKDPTAVEKTVTETGQKLADVSKGLTNVTDGTLTVALRGQDSLVKDYSDQIKRFNGRLAAKQEILSRQYDALDSVLSKLNAQGSWLTGQLNALNGNSSKT